MKTDSILFIIFNRPETTQKVFGQIKKAKPKRLFIAADGPRGEKIGEKELCEKTRKIATDIDWPCEIKTLFREKNLGCRVAVSGAINWFFENVEQGIILEDDCVPNESFFTFCNQMLELYKEDDEIMMITGTNYLDEKIIAQDYFFSKYYSIWGWATWKRAWQKYDIDMIDWPVLRKKRYLEKHLPWTQAKFYKIMFNSVYRNKVNTWDIQWVYSCIINRGLCCTPSINLVSNIGENGTHDEKNSPYLYKNAQSFTPNILFSKKIIRYDSDVDKYQFETIKIKKAIILYYLFLLPITIKNYLRSIKQKNAK